MKYNKTLSILAFASLFFAACNKSGDSGDAPSDAGFFSQARLVYSLASTSEITIPVVRLGTSGDLTVNVTSTGASEFSVPSSCTIMDGERIGTLNVTFDSKKLAYMESYLLNVSISGFNSIYGYETAEIQIDNPMPANLPYAVYGSGKIVEGWWGEEEEKDLLFRDCGGGIYQCYLPECWGHDSGAGYPVQDYVFYWDTNSNKLYIPFQFMGCEDWCIGDQGSIACKFNGPDYADGLRVWREYADMIYASSSFPQPHYDPVTKAFYLSDSAARNPESGVVVYGSEGTPDVFTLL